MTEPTDDQIEAFKEAWNDADAEGRVGERVRDGLRAALSMNRLVEFVRCGVSGCHQDYRHAFNLLNQKPVWMSPQKKRGGCQHPIDDAEALLDGEWLPMMARSSDD